MASGRRTSCVLSSIKELYIFAGKPENPDYVFPSVRLVRRGAKLPPEFPVPEDVAIGRRKYNAQRSKARLRSMEGMLQAFPLYFNFNVFNGTYTDWGCGRVFTREVAQDLIRYIQDNGGFFVLLHPASPNATEGPKSGELMDFWLADGTGFEVFVGWEGPSENYKQTADGYELWKQLLAAGKKIYATAGSDTHGNPKNDAMSTIYVTERNAKNYLDCLRAGDFSPSPMGVRMVIGDTCMGGTTSFDGQKVVFSVGDFHSYVTDKRSNFRAVLVDDKGEVFRQDFTAEETVYFSVGANPDAKFYRVEIYDADEDLLIGLGNPIWNTNN
jgi:hypothetical protein